LGFRNSALFLVARAALFAQDIPSTPAPEYAGPAILSRGTGATVRTPSETIRLRPFIRLNGTYDTGITAPTVDQFGQLQSVSSFGADVDAGVRGYHTWRKTTLNLDYNGNYRHYAKNSYYNGSDQLLTLGVETRVTPRISFQLRESAGTYARSFGDFGNNAGGFDPQFTNVPINELLDNRTNYYSSLADLVFRKTARLSFDIGGDVFLVRRQSNALYGVTGSRARADVAYRYTRHSTIGIAYNFMHFSFTKGFGASDVHTVAIIHSTRLTRRWELSLEAGGARAETLGLTQVSIDPVVAAIIGQTSGIEVIYRVNYVPNVAARLSGGFRHSAIGFGYTRGVSPGNGVFLTSRTQTAIADYTYTGIRKWHFGINGGYDSFGSLSRNLNNYSGYRGGAGVTYQISRFVHFVTQFDARRYEVADTTFKRVQYRAQVGFGFAPGDIPLSLW
jgi:hypothetical protein